MNITEQELITMGAHEGLLKRFTWQTNNTSESVNLSSLVGGMNSYCDLLWIAGELLSKESIIQFTCECALLNIGLIDTESKDVLPVLNFLKHPDIFTAQVIVNTTSNHYAEAIANNDTKVSTFDVIANTAAYSCAYSSDSYTASRDAQVVIALSVNGISDDINTLLIKLFTKETN